jgi:transcriptional regulator with XRE-family HTH domain
VTRGERARHLATQVILAEHTGLDRSFLADVERGKRNISILNLYLVAKGLPRRLRSVLMRFSSWTRSSSVIPPA